MLKDRGCWCKKRQKPSPISQSCRQHISSPTSVTNIHHQYPSPTSVTSIDLAKILRSIRNYLLRMLVKLNAGIRNASLWKYFLSLTQGKNLKMVKLLISHSKKEIVIPLVWMMLMTERYVNESFEMLVTDLFIFVVVKLTKIVKIIFSICSLKNEEKCHFQPNIVINNVTMSMSPK